jgi:hypothetical protein
MNLPPRFAQQTLSGYVRQHLALLEDAVEAGVSYASLGQLLTAAGFGQSLPMNSLASALFRARHATRRRNRVSGQPHVAGDAITVST